MPDPARTESLPTEWLLARIVGRERAAAIIGDLLEISAGRGRLWFWAAYARTVVALTWRIPVALFGAVVCREFIFNLFHLYLRHTPTAWRNASGSYLDLLNASGPLLACIMSTLWFALPYAVVLYGVRDRFVRLAGVVTLGTTVAFLSIPFASLFVAVATLALAAVALISKKWRKPLEVLAWTAGAGVLTIGAASALRLTSHPHGGAGRALASYAEMLAFQGSLLVLAVVCSRLHSLLLPERPSMSN